MHHYHKDLHTFHFFFQNLDFKIQIENKIHFFLLFPIYKMNEFHWQQQDHLEMHHVHTIINN